MGTVLSLSPGLRKAAARGPEKLAELAELAVQKPPEAREAEEEEELKDVKKKKKRHPVLLHALSWKKRLVAARAKRKGGKKVKPAVSEPGHVQREQGQQAATDSRHRALKAGHRHGPIPVPVPTVPEHSQRPKQDILSPRRVVVQASTGELLRCLSDFLCRRCVKLKELSSNQVVVWFRNVDRALLVQGWQDQCFISPASLVFVYLLCRDVVDEDTSSEQELHATFLTCLYMAYSYLGNEISYPLKPFLVESSRDAFWERALELIDRLSADMLRINVDPHFFTEVFQDLKNQGGARVREGEKERGRGKEEGKERGRGGEGKERGRGGEGKERGRGEEEGKERGRGGEGKERGRGEEEGRERDRGEEEGRERDRGKEEGRGEEEGKERGRGEEEGRERGRGEEEGRERGRGEEEGKERGRGEEEGRERGRGEEEEGRERGRGEEEGKEKTKEQREEEEEGGGRIDDLDR